MLPRAGHPTRWRLPPSLQALRLHRKPQCSRPAPHCTLSICSTATATTPQTHPQHRHHHYTQGGAYADAYASSALAAQNAEALQRKLDEFETLEMSPVS